MYNLYILYLRCLLICLCKQKDTEYIATKGLVIRSTVERIPGDKGSNSFQIQEYVQNSKKHFNFNTKTEVILLKGSTISNKQKNICKFTVVEDVKVEATEFEIDCDKLVMETRDDSIFHVKSNATLPLVCQCYTKYNELSVLTLLSGFSYKNNTVVLKDFIKRGIYCTDTNFIINERTVCSGETVKMIFEELVLIQTNKIKDLLDNKTIVAEIPIDGKVEITNIDAKKLLNVKEDAKILMNNTENKKGSNTWIFELVFGLSLAIIVLMGIIAVVIYYTKRRNITIDRI